MRRFSCRSVFRPFGTVKETPIPPFQSAELAGSSPLVLEIATSIEKLTLLETAALVKLLKIRLNLPDISLGASSFQSSTLGSSPQPAETGPIVQTKPAEKTEFKVILQKVDPSSKAKTIREIKTILPGLNLVEAKTFVESAPKVVKENLNKEEAEKLRKTLEDLGATITVE